MQGKTGALKPESNTGCSLPATAATALPRPDALVPACVLPTAVRSAPSPATPCQMLAPTFRQRPPKLSEALTPRQHLFFKRFHVFVRKVVTQGLTIKG